MLFRSMRRLRAAGVGAASVVICGRDGRGGANGMSFSDARGRAVPVSRQDAAVVREIARFLFRGFSGDRIVHGVVEFDACSGIVEVFRKECGMIDVPAECDEENVEDGGLSY